jgi:hypothetical protein
MDSSPRLLLIAALLPVLLCCGGGYVLLSSAVDTKTRKAREFGDEVVRRVTAQEGWNANLLRSYGSDQFQKQYSVVELAQTVTGPPGRTLGAYRTGKSYAKVVEKGSEKAANVVDYQNSAEFDHGSAVVRMELTEVSNRKWAVTSFAVAPTLSR